jgi:two-component system chemotaxis response regulator CheB
MPRAAIAAARPHAILSLAALGRTIVDVAGTQADPDGRGPSPPPEGNPERRTDDDAGDGRLSPLSCPDCGGTLWEMDDGGVLRFECRVGHAYSEASMLEQQGKALEMALWTSLRVLEERAELNRRLSRRLARRGSSATAASFERQAVEAEEHAVHLRRLLERIGADAAPNPFAAAEQAQQTG